MSKSDRYASHNTAEIARIRGVYKTRDQGFLEESNYAPDDAGYRFALKNRQKDTRNLLRKVGIISLKDLRILEVGSGYGTVMLEYSSLGADWERLFGCDLVHSRLRQSMVLTPALNQSCADGQNLPFLNASFDLVSQYTVFSSVLEQAVRVNLANEMRRVLKPGGIILWYDFWLNPTNPQTRGVRPVEVRKLFPGSKFIFLKTTLAPPITRQVIGISKKTCTFLEKLKIFNSHYLAAVIPE